jgi:TRAP-type C4-dicarboxylate transport system substrate-binding protein
MRQDINKLQGGRTMEKKRLIILSLRVCIILLFVMLFIIQPYGLAKASEEKPIVWKFSSFVPAMGLDTLPVNWFVQEAEKRSNGRLKFKMYWGEQLASAKETLEAVKTGVADIAMSCSPYYPGKVPLSTLGFLPFTNPRRVDHIGATWFYLRNHPLLVKENERWNARVLFSTANEPFNLISKKAISSVDDFKGLKIRSIGDQVKLFQAMGAVPVSLTAPDSYMALERGLCDAVAGGGQYWFYDFKIFEACKGGYYIINLDINSSPCQYLVNLDSFKALPADIKQILEDLAWEVIPIYHELFASQEVKKHYKDIFSVNGIKFISFPAEERKKMLAFAQPVWDAWKERAKHAGGYEFFEAFEKAKEKVLREYPDGIYKERPLPSWIREALPKK